jgi:glycosyltransferase involved in cell wall biosynthesis
LLQHGMLQERQLLWIPGSGVDLNAFNPSQHEQNTVLFPARLLTDKGIREFVEAARQLKAAGYSWQFVLAGEAGAANPAAVSEAQVSEWVAEGCVRWLGHVADMRPVYAEAAIVCLPSYREGMPKALLEAAAAGKPVVTTDAVGCREAIEPGVTGTLVPVADVPALVKALAELIQDAALRLRYGRAGRERAERIFGIGPVVSCHLALYQGHQPSNDSPANAQ